MASERSEEQPREVIAQAAWEKLQEFKRTQLEDIVNASNNEKNRSKKVKINIQMLHDLIDIPEVGEYFRSCIAGSRIDMVTHSLLGRRVGKLSVYPDFTEFVTPDEFSPTGHYVRTLYNHDREKLSEMVDWVAGDNRAFINTLSRISPDAIFSRFGKASDNDRRLKSKRTKYKNERFIIGPL